VPVGKVITLDDTDAPDISFVTTVFKSLFVKDVDGVPACVPLDFSSLT
jgi:hypothetical protein